MNSQILCSTYNAIGVGSDIGCVLIRVRNCLRLFACTGKKDDHKHKNDGMQAEGFECFHNMWGEELNGRLL
jgi:hypothetical protein